MRTYIFRYLLTTLFILILSSTPVLAQCGGIPESACNQMANCFWDGDSCNIYTNYTEGSVFSNTYQNFIADIGLKSTLNSIPNILNALVPLLIVLSGLILFFMLIAGGFQLLTSAANPDDTEKGKQKITNALIGFIIIFAAYWITQIVEIVLGVKILN